MPEEVHHIEACEPPRLLRTHARSAGLDGQDHDWRVEIRLTEDDGGTILHFGQILPKPEWAHNIGPGRDYYEMVGPIGDSQFGLPVGRHWLAASLTYSLVAYANRGGRHGA